MLFGRIMTGSCGLSNNLAWVALIVLKGMYHIEYRISPAMLVFINYLIHITGHISKKHFRLGGMAPSEWTRSVRAVRDTLVADYSAPGANTTGHVAYRPLIAVSLFHLALLVSYCKQTLWRCGQL